MPRPKNSKNFGHRESQVKKDSSVKKKTEVVEEKKEEKLTEIHAEKAESSLETSETLVSDSAQKSEISDKTSEKETTEEFPDLDIGIDVFSPPIKDSTISEKDEEEKKEEKIKEIKEKAKKLAEKIEEKPIDMTKLTVKKTKKSEKTLFPLDDYVKYSAHLGTKAITPHMRQYVYKRRADGLAVLNTNAIDKKLKEVCKFLSQFKPENIFLACKREVGWPAARKFSEVTGIRVFTKKYPAGIITNTNLNDFFETELVIVCDPWLDKNAVNDAVKIKIPVIALCSTNNLTTGATKVIPCNNKAGKSIGLILYLLAREYLKARGEKKEFKLEDFVGKIEENTPIKEDREGRIIEEKVQGAKEGV